MVKGISRRVVVLDSPDQRFFEQAIFIVRNDAAGGGDHLQRTGGGSAAVAHSYVAGGSRFGRAWRSLNPMAYTLMGAGAIGLAWLAVTLI